MGGKQKQSQRTKNNAKPASSGRSGELLTNAFRTETLAGSATASKLVPNIFPTQVAVGLDHGLNPEINVCIKKLNKKDPITKVKALQELTDLVKKVLQSEVVAMLPAWTHYYKILSVDVDRKVREGTQVCHGAIVLVCGREIAPWLRAIMPVWIQARSDEDSNTQRAALAASPFPDHKLPEVISFCKAEIIAQLLENIIGNIDSKISKKIEDPEERQQHLHRLTTSALQGLQYLCSQLPGDQAAWLWGHLEQLLNSTPFWKLANHSNLQVRRSWYTCMSGIVAAVGGQAAAAGGARLLRALLGQGGGAAAAEQWSCLLAFITSVPDWQKYLEKKELLTKRILDILENGGWGAARSLLSLLLPLLASLPDDILTQDFYAAFFNAALNGLQKKIIISSKSARASWLASIAECVRYVSTRHDGAGGGAVCASAAQRHWCSVVLSADTDNTSSSGLITQSAAAMSALVQFWLRQNYDALVRSFWQNIASTALAQLDAAAPGDLAQVVERQVLFLRTLKTSTLPKPEKMSVRFADENPQSEQSSPVHVVLDPAIAQRYDHDLLESIAQVGAGQIRKATASQMSCILGPVHEVLQYFDSPRLLMSLARRLESNSLLELYTNVLSSCLSADAMRCRPAADLVFDVAKHMTEAERTQMFASFKAFPPSVLEWCISLSLSPPHNTSDAGKRWLRGTLVADTLVLLTYRAIEMKDDRARQMLVESLSKETDDGFAITGACLASITSLVSQALTSPTSLQSSATLTADILCVRNDIDLLIPLCRLVTDQKLSSELPEDLVEKCVAACRRAVAARRHAAGAMADSLVPHLLQQLLSSSEELDFEKVHRLSSFCSDILPLAGAASPAATQEVVTFSKAILQFPTHDDLPLEFYALRQDCISFKLSCPFEDENDIIKKIVEESSTQEITELTKSKFIAHAYRALFRAMYLNTILTQPEDSAEGNVETEDGEGEHTEPVEEDNGSVHSLCNVLLQESFIKEQFADLLHEYEIMCSLYDGYVFWSSYDIVQETKRSMENCVDSIIKAMSKENRTSILEYLTEKAVSVGYCWSYARKTFEDKIMVDLPDVVRPDKELDLTKLSEVITGSGYFHSLQADTGTDEDAMLTCHYQVMLRSLFAAFCDDRAVMSEQLVADAVRCCRSDDIEVVSNLYYRHNDTMLYGRDISNASWRQINYVTSVCRTLSQLVRMHTYSPPSPMPSPARSLSTPSTPQRSTPLSVPIPEPQESPKKVRPDYVDASGAWHPAHHWDFMAITLCSLLESVNKSKHHLGTTKVSLLSHAVLELYTAMSRHAAGAAGARRAEWADVFLPDLNKQYLELVLFAIESNSLPPTSSVWHVQRALLASAPHASLPADAAHVRRVLGSCGLALSSEAAPRGMGTMLLAHELLRSAAPALAVFDDANLAAWGAESSPGELVLSVNLLLPHLTRAMDAVDVILRDVTVGVPCELPADYDTFGVTVGAALLAHRMLALSAAARAQRAHHLLLELKESGEAIRVLNNSFRLLPAGVWEHEAKELMPPPYLAMFTAEPCFDITELWTVAAHLSCRSVLLISACLGGVLCAYHATTPLHKVYRIITNSVSKELVTRQLKSAAKVDIEDGSVEIHWSTLEAVLSLEVEDTILQLSVRLSRSHPLHLPTVHCTSTAAASPRWLPAMIAHQNGSLARALRLWADGTRARVSAAPACYICYSRLAGGALPSARCRHCRNKYHAACLRKWFATSQKSNCPLCRSNF